MENNRFAQNKTRIAEISCQKDVDISVAMAILAHENGWKDYGEESMAFLRYVNGMPADERAAYFQG